MILASQLRNLLALSLTVGVLASCDKGFKEQPPDPVVIIAGNADISNQINAFRQVIGGQVNTTPNAVGGRREINWDGIPDEMLDKKLPENYFNNTEPAADATNKRGLLYSPVGSFQVSQTNFTAINAGAAEEFMPFSGNKNFANVSSDLWDVEFQVPGQNVGAKVQAFGAVFIDVDKSNSTYIEFFNGDVSLGKAYVPMQHSSSKFSFLGVYFREQTFTRVRISHVGHLSEGLNDVTDGGTKDLIVLDDFIYSEPVAK